MTKAHAIDVTVTVWSLGRKSMRVNAAGLTSSRGQSNIELRVLGAWASYFGAAVFPVVLSRFTLNT